MGQPRRFGSSYYSLFHDLLNVEECTVFSFADHAEPQPLLVEGRCESRTAKARAVAVDYISDGYRYDPNIRDYDDALAVYAIGVDDISDVNYRARFYETPDVTQELVVLGRSGQSLLLCELFIAPVMPIVSGGRISRRSGRWLAFSSRRYTAITSCMACLKRSRNALRSVFLTSARQHTAIYAKSC